ncbi:MAG: hypothetical protein ACLFSW_04695 [Halobacteriales archaeon]
MAIRTGEAVRKETETGRMREPLGHRGCDPARSNHDAVFRTDTGGRRAPA